MPRIRSIHPGIFTDEAYMSASPYARLLLPGIWCEAWDDGVIEIRPLRLKARIFPVDAVDVEELLQELVRLGFLKPFEVGGKKYAAIRNFRKWQSPKKPNSSGVLPAGLHEYVGLSNCSRCGGLGGGHVQEIQEQFDGGSQSVEDWFGTGTEKSQQKGGREERKKGESLSSLRSDNAPTTSSRDPDENINAPVTRNRVVDSTSTPEAGVSCQLQCLPSLLEPALSDLAITPTKYETPHADANNPRTILFGWGLDVLTHTTGRPEKRVRAWIGVMLKNLRDDAAALNAIIHEFQRVQPANPEAWMSAAVKARASPASRAIRNGFVAMMADEPVTPQTINSMSE